MLQTDYNRNEEDTLFRFCNSLQLAVIIISADLYIEKINSITQKIFKRNRNELVKKQIVEIFRELGFQCPVSNSQNVIKPTLHTLSDGRIVNVHWTVSCRTDENSRKDGYLLTGKVFEEKIHTLVNKPHKIVDHILLQFPGAIYCKNLEGKYISANDYLAVIAGFKKKKMIIDREDFEMPWSDVANELRLADEKAVNGNKTIVTEEYPRLFNGERVIMLSTKSPLFDNENKTIGTISTSVNISTFQQDKFFNDTQGSTLRLDKNDKGVHLTKREIECANWLIKGKSAAEIGIILSASEKTVVTHIENIKRKLNCYKQFQLGYLLGRYGSFLLRSYN